ncbi:MAG: MarC family protein [Actinobacteria bacterium]|nr:MarC family protein [Actinomycetota bacterium]
MAFFAIIDPIGNLPVFAILTAAHTLRARLGVAAVSIGAAGALLLLATFYGRFALRVLNISIESFQIAAGLLLLLPAIRLVDRGVLVDPAEAGADRGIVSRALVPPAIPLLAGPGAIATAVVYGETRGGSVTVIAIVAVLALTLALLALTTRIVHIVGDAGLRVMARVVGILLTAIAVQLIVGGLDRIF